MKSAQSLDRDDFPFTNRLGGGEQGVVILECADMSAL